MYNYWFKLFIYTVNMHTFNVIWLISVGRAVPCPRHRGWWWHYFSCCNCWCLTWCCWETFAKRNSPHSDFWWIPKSIANGSTGKQVYFSMYSPVICPGFAWLPLINLFFSTILSIHIIIWSCFRFMSLYMLYIF